jgi:hypothetical protein
MARFSLTEPMKFSKPVKLADTSAARLKSANTDGWARKFRDLLCSPDMEVPEEGFYTTDEWCEIMKIGKARMGFLIRRGKLAGTVEARKFRVRLGKVVRSEWHYRITEPQ